jgi:endoglucanase
MTRYFARARTITARTAIVLAALGLAACADKGSPTGVTTPPAVISGDAASVERALGRGVNFGNILEAPSEGAWGLWLSDSLFNAAAASGAVTIRLPVRFSNHALATRPYTLDPTFLYRVDYAVAAALARGMRIVLDFHGYRQLDGDALDYGEFAVDPSVLDERFIAIWSQLAAHYRNQPLTVLFELYNEPHGALTAARWNTLLANTLTEIRRVDAARYIVVGPVSWNNAYALASLQLPGNDQRLIATIHNYEPFDFTHQGADWAGMANSPTMTCCTAAQVARMTAPLDVAAQWRTTWERPVWVGEFGSYEKGPYDSRVLYTRTIRDAIEARGMTFAYWEFAAGFGIFNQSTNTWKPELRDALLR